MRFLKLAPGVDIFAAIAGEMLNIETSTLYFLNGVPLTLAERSADLFDGYPRVTYDNTVDIVRAVSGYIYVPVGTNLNDFESKLTQKLLIMQLKMVDLKGATINLSSRYQTIKASHATNVKALIHPTHAGRTVPSTSSERIREADSTRPGRLFTHNIDTEPRYGRFVWGIKFIDQFDFEIHSNNMVDAVSRYVSSIFYDGDNISTLDHNAVTFDFSLSLLVGHRNITNQTLTIFENGDPLLIELSEFWHDQPPNPTTSPTSNLRNLSAIVYAGRLDDFDIAPVKFIDGTDRMSTNICACCRSILWGSNYVLTQVNSDAIAMCPMCLHSSRVNPPVEHTCDKVYVVKFPLSAADMLLSPLFSNDKRDVLAEAIKGVRKHVTEKNEDVYYLIGDKYLGIGDTDRYLYTKLSTDPEISNRKVCTVNVIH
jgi:hypothetical protein